VDGGPVTTSTRQRRRTARWIILALIVITLVGSATAYLTAPRPGGRMDAESTSPDGAHAIVSLLEDRGVRVTVAKTVADVENAARPDSLLLAAETYNTRGDDLLRRLAAVPGDRLILEPTARARAILAPGIRISSTEPPSPEPDCDLRAATQAGPVDFQSGTYVSTGDTDLTRCYGGAVVRYYTGNRTITVVDGADFMTNGSLLKEGNAALAMNLAGERPELIWYAPQHAEGMAKDGSTIGELIPDAVIWIVWQLILAVGLVALWQGRRLGPLVAERLPVVVRASETVEGRARLYRSRRARAQAAGALRAASLHRLLPRLGLGANASDSAIAMTIAQRCLADVHRVHHALFGPVPNTDDELLHLAHELDDIERQVTQT
jgi:hypothetical protein